MMKKIFTFDTKKKTVKESTAKRSIMLRWAFANTVFCFIYQRRAAYFAEVNG